MKLHSLCPWKALLVSLRIIKNIVKAVMLHHYAHVSHARCSKTNQAPFFIQCRLSWISAFKNQNNEAILRAQFFLILSLDNLSHGCILNPNQTSFSKFIRRFIRYSVARNKKDPPRSLPGFSYFYAKRRSPWNHKYKWRATLLHVKFDSKPVHVSTLN